MITKEEVIVLTNKLRKELGIKNEIKVEFKKYKRLLGNASIKGNVIRLNEDILNTKWVKENYVKDQLEFIKKLIKHELMHIKTKSKWHDPKYFWDLL